jgi:methylated-DNA-[protein]-cysteine S-methyltransferase
VAKIDVKKLNGTIFQKKVWGALLKIPKGKTVTYKELATRIGKPMAIRAVANAVGANPMAPLIPCHRVIRSDGTLGGYSGGGGIKTKKALLAKEGVRC